MLITRIEREEQTKCRIYIDGEYAFLLSLKELEHYKLTEGVEITSEHYNDILYGTVLLRAKQKALSILKYADRTETELKKKLGDAGFTDEIIDKAIDYVNNYGYIDDERLAAAYTRSRMNRKSKLVIKTELLQKGIRSELIDKIFMEEYGDCEKEDAEMTAIRKAIAKKTKEPENLEYEEKQKLIASLYRKGFDISKIKQALS